MKNAIIIILLLTSLAGGYYALSQYRIPLGDPGKTEKIIRSDLTLPINATGEVRPARRIVIKAEASGEVLNIYRQDGEFVEAGELLIRLEKDEEQRSVDRAQQDLDRADARLKTAEVVLERCQTTDRDNARAAVDQIQATLKLAKFRADWAAAKPETFHEEELIQRKGAYQSQLAQLAGAQAQLRGVDLAVRQAEQDVEMSRASRATALTVLEDAKKRLRKTEIKAPISGILARVRTHVGEVIQGGKTTFTGGTELAVILDIGKMLVRAEVDESDLERVLVISPDWAKPGNDGSISVPSDFKMAAASMEHVPKVMVEAYRNREFEGVIERIYPEPKVLSGVVTYQVDVVVIDDEGEMLFPQMRAEVEFTSEHVSDVLICPNEAIRKGPDDDLGVYVPADNPDDPDSEPKFLPCKFGLSNGSYSEVKEGLEKGVLVYTKLPRKVRKGS